MTAKLPHIPDIERLSPRVIRILGGNPGKFQLQGTNTYLVGQGAKRLLIDTGEGKPLWRESLGKVLKDESATIDRVILTHWHPDHVGGVEDVLQLSPGVKILKNKPDDGQEDITNGQIFETEGASLRAFHSPGHTVDHMALILKEEDAMFTGDNVLGHGTAVFEDLTAYMDSLDRMKHEFKGRAYPGHGQVIDDGPAKITEYIAHRKQREEEALDVLSQPRTDGQKGWQSMELVKVIYKAYPEALHIPAQGSLVHVLKKLQAEGKTQEVDGRWSVTSHGKM
ncbi:hypothetical protein AMS68_005663 [Peltaster fructicola]|uniref:Metallo-beta-lactamase domain-containing protein n=1 Tax=Peltaster fructicola TaxID=286661 RepID=A0A6H0XZN9_9PEZI|nr:hypothetical protein AMS68_005663 [Peltaster fructicola]